MWIAFIWPSFVVSKGGGLVWVCPDPSIKACEPDAATQAVIAELEHFGCADSVVFDSETRLWINEFFRFAKFEGALTQSHRRLDERLGRS